MQKSLRIYVEEGTVDELDLDASVVKKLTKYKVDESLADKVDFIVTLGGDGTLIHASSMFQVGTQAFVRARVWIKFLPISLPLTPSLHSSLPPSLHPSLSVPSSLLPSLHPSLAPSTPPSSLSPSFPPSLPSPFQ